jgi:hypothetical protein
MFMSMSIYLCERCCNMNTWKEKSWALVGGGGGGGDKGV